MAEACDGEPLPRRVRVLAYLSEYYQERLESLRARRASEPPPEALEAMEKFQAILSQRGPTPEQIKAQAKQYALAFGISEAEALAKIKKQYLGDDDSDGWKHGRAE